MLRRRALLVLFAAMLSFSACEKPSSPSAGSVVNAATSADGIPIRYEAAGKGDVALVFIHCWTCDRTFWDAQVAHFAPRFLVVRLDLAGHGESGRDRKTYTVAAFGEDVAAVAKKLDLKQAILVGHSMGGPVAMEAERLLGARVIGVVGVDTFYTGFSFPKDENAARDMTEKFMRPFQENFTEASAGMMRSMFGPGADSALKDRVAKNAASADKTIALSAMQELFGWYVRDADSSFRRVGVRLRNINGDPKSENRPLHANVVLIPGAGHFPAQEKPAEFNRALDTIVTQFVDAAAKKK